MKIRYFINLQVGLFLFLCMMACASDETTDAKPGSELLNVERDVLIPASQTSWTVNIISDCHWDVSEIDNPSWGELTISPRSGDGNGTLTVTTDRNRHSIERTANVILTTKGGLKQVINIHQEKSDAALSINQEEFRFNESGGLQNLIISSNANWSIQGATSLGWIEFGQVSGNTGVTEITMKVNEAIDDATRNALLTVSSGNSQVSFNVTQQGKSSIHLAVEPTELMEFPAEDSTQTVRIVSDAAWYAYVPVEDQSWLHVSPMMGIGNSEVTITCDFNPGYSGERISMIIFVAGTKNPKQVDLFIRQKQLSAAPEENDNPDPILSR